jgi:TPR repeat protein
MLKRFSIWATIITKDLGVKRDFKRAAELYRKAAVKGESRAQWNLALCYLEGEGVRANRRRFDGMAKESRETRPW